MVIFLMAFGLPSRGQTNSVGSGLRPVRDLARLAPGRRSPRRAGTRAWCPTRTSSERTACGRRLATEQSARSRPAPACGAAPVPRSRRATTAAEGRFLRFDDLRYVLMIFVMFDDMLSHSYSVGLLGLAGVTQY